MFKYSVTRANETLSAVVFMFYGQEFGYLEKVLAVNPFLSSVDGVFLPKNCNIYLPNLPSNQTIDRMSLWS